MGETETLSNLQMLIDALRPPPAPVDRQLWDSLDVARYLGLSREYIMSNIARRDGFPNQIRIAGGRPLWKAIEVTAWASADRGRRITLARCLRHRSAGLSAKRQSTAELKGSRSTKSAHCLHTCTASGMIESWCNSSWPTPTKA